MVTLINHAEGPKWISLVSIPIPLYSSNMIPFGQEKVTYQVELQQNLGWTQERK